MEQIAQFVAGDREESSVEKACINCPVSKFCACENARELFDIDTVMEKRLVSVGGGIKVSEPVRVEKNLRSGEEIFISLSHKGILAIHSNNNGYAIQFTDLNTSRQIELRVEDHTHVGFYDDKMIILTWDRPLREAGVEDLFKECNIAQFRDIGAYAVYSDADVSLLNETRVLYYRTTFLKLFSFNVDTRKNTMIDVGKGVWFCAFLTGIKCEAESLFQCGDRTTYILHKDNSVSTLERGPESVLRTLFPSGTSHASIKKAAIKYGCSLMYGGKKVDFERPFKFESWYSVVRIYRDIFLLYDDITKDWVLSRIVIP